jgi:hypothetical protein
LTKGINCNLWTSGLELRQTDKAMQLHNAWKICSHIMHDRCDENQEWQVEARVQALLQSTDNKTL